LAFQNLAYAKGRLDDRFPWNVFAWIEVDDEGIRSLKVLGDRIPGMQARA
jgi:hypothetical protein